MKLEKFWVVMFPTRNSEFVDVCFECDIGGLFLQALGGLKRGEIEGVYTTEGEADFAAHALLAARDDARLAATDEITASDLVSEIESPLLTRRGDTVTDELARERARNIAAALSGLKVKS
jgi:hypothetical protein